MKRQIDLNFVMRNFEEKEGVEFKQLMDMIIAIYSRTTKLSEINKNDEFQNISNLVDESSQYNDARFPQFKSDVMQIAMQYGNEKQRAIARLISLCDNRETDFIIQILNNDIKPLFSILKNNEDFLNVRQ